MGAEKILRQFACVVLFAAIASLSGFAQVRAGLHGRVLDPSGAAVRDASVELTETTKNIHRKTTTSASGDYVFGDLNLGDYQVEVAATGFMRLNLAHVYLAVGQTADVDLELKIGNDQQSLTVSEFLLYFSRKPAIFKPTFQKKR